MKKEGSINIFQMALVFIGVLVLGIIFKRVTFLFFMILTLAIFVGSVYYIIKHFRDAQKEKEFTETMEGSIIQNLNLCEDQIGSNQKEMGDIRQNILDLKSSIDNKMNINESSMRETELLISGFERELDLRKAKLDFYKICKKKIENIHFNQQLADKIASKKEKLKQLQEDHFDDLAEMEQLRSDMDYNKTYMDSINRLSLRMAESTSLSSAQELHNELKLITQELRDL